MVGARSANTPNLIGAGSAPSTMDGALPAPLSYTQQYSGNAHQPVPRSTLGGQQMTVTMDKPTDTLVTLDCGHKVKGHMMVEWLKGYHMCRPCVELDGLRALINGWSRAVVWFDRVNLAVTLKPHPNSKLRPTWRVGVATQFVVNDGARTPTGGLYKSCRMTVQTMVDVGRETKRNTWFANGPKGCGSGFITLRNAD